LRVRKISLKIKQIINKNIYFFSLIC